MNKSPLGWIELKEELPSCGKSEARIILFRKVLTFESHRERVIVNISADSRYKLYINGVFLEEGPQKGDNHVRFYDSLDITDALVPGKNVIVASVLTYPETHGKGNHSLFRTYSPGFFLQGFYSEKDQENKNPSFKADETWKSRSLPVEFHAESMRFAPLYIFESAQSDSLIRGMHRSDYDDSFWMPVVAHNFFTLASVLHPDNLKKRTIPFHSRQRKDFEGIQCIRKSSLGKESWESMLSSGNSLEIPPHRQEIVEINAGTETTAFLSLIMAGGRNAKITILTSECYAYEEVEVEDGSLIPRKGDRTDHVNGRLYGFTDHYQVGGLGDDEEPEIYEPYWFRTFRYIRFCIVTADEALRIKGFHYTVTAYPLKRETFIKTSDKSLEDIWDISERSLRCCMHDTYEDCPFYEQLQYAMDSRSQILYTYAISSDDRLARQCLDDFRRSLRPDGMINCSYPSFEPNLIPGFSIYYIGMIHDHMMYFGDRSLVEQHLPTILSILGFFRSRMTDRGIVGKIGGPNLEGPFWSFIDWTKEWKSSMGVPLASSNGPLTMESLLFVLGLQYSADLLDYINHRELAAGIREEADVLKINIRKNCSASGGMLKDGPGHELVSQHCQVFGVLTDTLSPEEGRTFLLETLRNKDNHAQCSVAMMFYLFRALEKCNLYGETNELWDVWRDMIKKNLTTCEEDPVTSRSDCHAWGALILFELPSVLLGIRPTAPGYSEMTLNPRFGHLDWAEGTVSTPKGPVYVSWNRVKDLYEMDLTMPTGISLRLEEQRPDLILSII